MIFPLYAHEVFGYEGGLVLGTVIGFLFGFVLERSGFGRAPVLAAQFYFSDMRVLKVMFSAIVTAALGIAVLSGVGLLDMRSLVIPETFLWPQIAGGFVLGVGFIVSGYCPGTAVVAAGSGNVDGLITLVGVGVGSLVFGVFYPVFEPLYRAGEMGVVRFPELLGLPAPVLAAGVALMAVGMFLGGEALERIFARRRQEGLPPGSPPLRNRVFAGFAAAALIGVATLLLPAEERPAPAGRPVVAIGPLELARLLVEQPAVVVLVDLRDPAACAAARIRGAVCRSAEDPGAEFLAQLSPTRRLVLYGGAEPPAVPDSARVFGGEVLMLEGGYPAFEQGILRPPAAPANPTPEALREFRLLAALHGHFTGATVAAPPPSAVPTTTRPARPTKRGGGC